MLLANFLLILKANLFSTPNLFFLLGGIIALSRSELKIPTSIYKFFIIYLITIIGLKGGAKISEAGIGYNDMKLIILVLSACFALPFIGFAMLNRTTNLDNQNKVLLAAQYGSVSLTTFVAAVSFLDFVEVPYSKIMIAICALMELPAIFSGMIILSLSHGYKGFGEFKGNLRMLGSTLSNGSIILLCGSIVIGVINGKNIAQDMHFLFTDLFYGILCLFLLNMGMKAMEGLLQDNQLNFKIIAYAIYMPIISAITAFGIAKLMMLSAGDAMLLITLFASASYIVVPTVMTKTLKDANPGIYIPVALGVTFSINMMLGIPIYYTVAKIWFY